MSFLDDGDLMFNIDFKSGYHHVGLTAESFKFMGFEWMGDYYVFKSVTFWLESFLYGVPDTFGGSDGVSPAARAAWDRLLGRFWFRLLSDDGVKVSHGTG